MSAPPLLLDGDADAVFHELETQHIAMQREHKQLADSHAKLQLSNSELAAAQQTAQDTIAAAEKVRHCCRCWQVACEGAASGGAREGQRALIRP